MTKSSDFFRAARSLVWTSTIKPTELPEQDPSIFALYLDCLYDRTMPEFPALARPFYDSVDGDLREVEDANKILIAAHWEKLVGLYVLACYLLDPTTRNMTIDEIRRFLLRDWQARLRSSKGSHQPGRPLNAGRRYPSQPLRKFLRVRRRMHRYRPA
jgi:hypothetical protein